MSDTQVSLPEACCTLDISGAEQKRLVFTMNGTRKLHELILNPDIDPEALKVLYRLKNHGFVAYLVGLSADPASGVALARETITSGRGRRFLQRLQVASLRLAREAS